MGAAVLDGVSEFISAEHGLLVGGEGRAARVGERFDVVNPATAQVIMRLILRAARCRLPLPR